MVTTTRSDQATFEPIWFIDNLARAIRYATRQLVDMIPKIYDTQRVARIVGLDIAGVDLVAI